MVYNGILSLFPIPKGVISSGMFCNILATLTRSTTRILMSCCRWRRRTRPTMTSVGTTSRSRKNSDSTLAMSLKELCNGEGAFIQVGI